jgi:hypothetical protein
MQTAIFAVITVDSFKKVVRLTAVKRSDHYFNTKIVTFLFGKFLSLPANSWNHRQTFITAFSNALYSKKVIVF